MVVYADSPVLNRICAVEVVLVLRITEERSPLVAPALVGTNEEHIGISDTPLVDTRIVAVAPVVGAGLRTGEVLVYLTVLSPERRKAEYFLVYFKGSLPSVRIVQIEVVKLLRIVHAVEFCAGRKLPAEPAAVGCDVSTYFAVIVSNKSIERAKVERLGKVRIQLESVESGVKLFVILFRVSVRTTKSLNQPPFSPGW